MTNKDYVRESMIVLPNRLQPFLTWLTAKPYDGQKPWETSVLYYPISGFSSILAGTSLGFYSILQGSLCLFLLPIAWVFTLHGIRKLRGCVYHSCAHHAVIGKKYADYFLGKVIAVFTLTGDFCNYRNDHLKTHHSEFLLTSNDEFYLGITRDLGLPLGIPKSKLWRLFWSKMLSPVYHSKVLFVRVQSTLFSIDRTQNVLAFMFWSLVFVVVFMTGTFSAFFFAVLLPISVLYEMGLMIEISAEHHWPLQDSEFSNARERLSYLTSAIFSGEKTPDNSSVKDWTYWYLRMFFYHLPTRILIMPADIATHDFHHENPGSREWKNGIFAREKDMINNPHKNYTHTWGVIAAVDKLFESMSIYNE